MSGILGSLAALIKGYFKGGQIYCTYYKLIQPLLLTNWFPKKYRAIATTIACMTNSFGVLIGFSLPSWFIDEYNDSIVLTD